MVLVSLFFLFVFLFGAYAYGAATVFAVRQMRSVWGGGRQTDAGRPSVDLPSLGLFTLSTAWFVVHALIEFRNLTGDTQQGWLDLATLMVYLFPPVIMHTVYTDATCVDPAPRPVYRWLLVGMYGLAPAAGTYAIGAIFDVVPRPTPFGPWIAMSIGGLFMLASAYATTLMLQGRRAGRTPDQLRLRNVMIFLFAAMSVLFLALMVSQEQRLAVGILDRLARTAPIYFLIAAVYYENRFEFYDLVVKRALLLLSSVAALALFLALALPRLELLPGGPIRPWLFAVALAPIAMVMPWLHAAAERWLDRIWLGREFTPVDAVKHVLAAMQPATDERTLLEAAEARLNEIFGARFAVLLGDEVRAGAPIETEVSMPTPVSGQPVRIAVIREPGTRRILSEDLALLRSLAGVLGYMLENLRLQQKRQEQDQLAQALRLQSSKSELKALRAQINPHFLFNALNAIASLIHSDPTRADEAVEQLAEVFRYTLRRSDTEWAPLDQELTFARAYLDVEQARFGQRLTCTIDADHPQPPPHVPSMLLQTLLENAVKHGVSQAREPGRIDLIVRTSATDIVLEVRNTGPGPDGRGAGPREGEGFGLHSVRERLRAHFGDRASFSLTRDADRTVARIRMPLVRMAA